MDDNPNPPVEPTGFTPPEATPPELTPTPEPIPPAQPAKKSKKPLVVVAAVLVVLLVGAATAFVLLSNKPEPTPTPQPTPIDDTGSKDRLSNLKETVGVTTVPSLLDEIKDDSAWCGTFQLVWNDMKNELVGGDVVFTDGQLTEVDNLNKETFTDQMLSEDYYYKKYGLKTLDLKAEIEKGIKDKFDETSDVLGSIDWSVEALNQSGDDVDRYLFYVMLKRVFDYEYPFERLDDAGFKDTKDVKYYGFKSGAESNLRKQIEVLYYESDDNFAILVNTKQGDQVIYVKNPTAKTFGEIYDGAIERSQEFTGQTIVQNIDSFQAPDLALSIKREYNELVGHPFLTKKGTGEITAAIQTIKLAMDEVGGEVKSEAVIDMEAGSATPDDEPTPQPQPRHFYLDDTFAVFLREKGKSQPYLAAYINDITKYQQ